MELSKAIKKRLNDEEKERRKLREEVGCVHQFCGPNFLILI